MSDDDPPRAKPFEYENIYDGYWHWTRWWRVIEPDGSVWCESSDEQENREARRPGDTLLRLEQRVESRWVEVPADG